MNKYKKKDCYNYMPPFTDDASDSGEDAKNVRTTGEPKHYIHLKENKGWKLLWTKSHVRKKVRTLADSGCSCTIFTDRNLFTDYQPYSSPFSTAGGTIRSTDYQPYSSPISTAGGTIRSTGRGTVGNKTVYMYLK